MDVELRALCHSRAGDKGGDLNLSLIPYDPNHYDLIRELVTPERVARYFGSKVGANVVRYELPNLGALNFVLHGALNGGSTKSLSRDIHGKAMSGVFLDMKVALPDNIRLPLLPV